MNKKAVKKLEKELKEKESPKEEKDEEEELEEEFEVKEILDKKITNGEEYYRIRWKGYGPENDTWEPKENLTHCQELLDEFEKGFSEVHEEEKEIKRKRRDVTQKEMTEKDIAQEGVMEGKEKKDLTQEGVMEREKGKRKGVTRGRVTRKGKNRRSLKRK